MVAVKKDRISGDALGTGRRKAAVARVRIRPGSGKIIVNGIDVNEYFKNEQDRRAALEPLHATGKQGSVDVIIRAEGGGTTGQAGACRMGIARALLGNDEGHAERLGTEARHAPRLGRDLDNDRDGSLREVAPAVPRLAFGRDRDYLSAPAWCDRPRPMNVESAHAARLHCR